MFHILEQCFQNMCVTLSGLVHVKIADITVALIAEFAIETNTVWIYAKIA